MLKSGTSHGENKMSNAVKQAAPVIHFEIGCKDSESTKAFYKEAFGWSINQRGPAAVIDPTEKGIGGHITSLGHEPHNYVTVYLQVDNIDEYLERIEKLGGKKIIGPVPIPTGRFAWFSDPEGNMLGLQEPKK